MKAISLHQPFASAVILGAKVLETRGWATSHRGPIAIHASKHRTIEGMIRVHSSWTWCGALAGAGVKMGQNERLENILPFGAVIGVVDLVDCRPTGSLTVDELDSWRKPAADAIPPLFWTERMLGNFEPGRFAWTLANPRPLHRPVPAIGRQRIFNLAPDVVAKMFVRAVER